MITTSNYFDTVEHIGFENLPLPLQQAHTVILVKTNEGSDWSAYDRNKEFKAMVDEAFSKLDKLVKKQGLSGASKHKRKTAKKYLGITTEVSFINRFTELHNKRVTKGRLEKFIDQLQQAIRKGKIGKGSPVADEIIEMQDFAVGVFNRMSASTLVAVPTALLKRLKQVVSKHTQAKKDWKENKPRSSAKDKGLSGLSLPNGKIMCSTDFTKLDFETLGFKNPWLGLIGDPCAGFTCMIFGLPKMGKSYLAVDFAGYLCRNHGPVLYVAREEKLDATLQKKLREKEVTHPDLFVSDHLPGDLTAYKFVFLDSVNKLRLTPQQLEKLNTDNPNTSFIYIFQTRKDGRFRGANQFQHDVDVVIEIPEKGKAVQFGRFNQGGEMDIFPDEGLHAGESSVTLAGVKKQPKAADQEKALKNLADRGDDLNPAFIFSTTASQLLSEALQGKFDLDYLVRRELANRGQDENGEWVGFDKAQKLHKVE